MEMKRRPFIVASAAEFTSPLRSMRNPSSLSANGGTRRPPAAKTF